MPETDPTAAEIASLKAKLEASRNLPGYAERVKAIEARLRELEA